MKMANDKSSKNQQLDKPTIAYSNTEIFSDAEKAREHFEKLRWPDGPVCPHCGELNNAYRLEPKESKKDTHVRKGVWKCAGCRKQFTVTVKSIFEDSHIPLHKWLLAIHLLCSSKKGMSAHQLMRMLDIKQYKSAWFMAHRIRYAMTGELPEKMNGIVEADETYVGGRAKNKHKKAHSHAVKPGVRAQDHPSPVADKFAVFSVLERDGNVNSRFLE